MKGPDEPYDCLVFIGRFQPFHFGHLNVIRAGLERAAMVIIVCGSARQPRSVRNPWNESEREQMIRGSLTEAENQRVRFAPVMDNPYAELSWLRDVENAVNALARTQPGGNTASPHIGLIGGDRQHTLYYREHFSQWGHIQASGHSRINATQIRDQLFGGSGALAYLHCDRAREQLPEHVIRALEKFSDSEAYKGIRAEYEYIIQYRQSWDAAPYPPVFVTVDNVVVHGENILLIERDDFPGKGLLALPGGFINEYEKLVDACIRELEEETSLALPPADLKKAIRKKEVFDYPYRSSRGRIITHVFHIVLDQDAGLPEVKGGDDARHARWQPLAGLDPAGMLEDHFFIIRKMLAG